MRHAGNFNPEWGCLVPAPSFLRSVRLVVVATAIGATASAAVVFSLADRPVAEETVAARTLVRSVGAIAGSRRQRSARRLPHNCKRSCPNAVGARVGVVGSATGKCVRRDQAARRASCCSCGCASFGWQRIRRRFHRPAFADRRHVGRSSHNVGGTARACCE